MLQRLQHRRKCPHREDERCGAQILSADNDPVRVLNRFVLRLRRLLDRRGGPCNAHALPARGMEAQKVGGEPQIMRRKRT